MLLNLKALVVVLTIAWIVFAMAKPVWLRFTSPEDFARRRMVWFVLTIVAFTSPSFWLYVLIGAPLMFWAGRRDSNPLGLYMLLFFVIPPMEITIPTLGINRLFDLNQVRLLGLTVLLPAAFARVESSIRGEKIGFSRVDGLLLAYGLLQLVLLVPYEASTNTLRRGFLFFLDTFLVYFAFSRLNERKHLIADSLGALCLSACIFAPLAVFETLRHWLLYIGIGESWGALNADAYLSRGDSLRAQVSTGHAIPLGYVLVVAIGCWLYLKSTQLTKSVNPFIFALLTLGIFVSYSRGPWLAAVLVPFIFVALSSQSAGKFAKGLLIFGACVGALLITPLGSSIIKNLPFVGTAGQETVEYRQQLAEISWRLIQENPWFGNPFVMLQMEELRQGQGIIDLVNAYATVALFNGLVGLTLFVGAFVFALAAAYAALRNAKMSGDWDSVVLGASLIACMLATLFVMAAGGFAWFQWLLLGLLTGYLRAEAHAAISAPQDSANVDLRPWPSRRRPQASPY